MLPHTYTPRPGESGQRASTPAQAVGEHIATPNNPRNIKTTCGWLWQEKAALRLLADAYSGERLRAARSVYLALTEVASNQFTPNRAHTSCAYLGEIAALGENAVRRYLHEFARLGLIAIEPAAHRANTYLLLAVAATPLEGEAMPLADSKGVSHAHRGIPSDTPAVPFPAAADSPTPLRGTRSGGQESRILQNQEESTTNRHGGVAIRADDITTTIANKPHIATEGGDEQSSNSTSPPPFTLSPQSSALTALTSLGVRRDVAAEVAATHDEQAILGWVQYAHRQAGLKSRAGFVLAMLRQGQEPPTSSYPLPTFVAPPEAAAELPAAAEMRAQAEPPHEAVLPPPSPTQQALWHTVKQELIGTASTSAKMWLTHMRLISVAADSWLLSSPATGRSVCDSDEYAREIATLLRLLLGREVAVNFQLGW